MLFFSKHRLFRLVLKPMNHIVVEGHRMLDPGKTVEFQDGMFETNDPELIKLMKSAKGYGVEFYTDSKDADTPSVETVKALNDVKAAAEEAGANCPECGKKFKTMANLKFHMKRHQ